MAVPHNSSVQFKIRRRKKKKKKREKKEREFKREERIALRVGSIRGCISSDNYEWGVSSRILFKENNYSDLHKPASISHQPCAHASGHFNQN